MPFDEFKKELSFIPEEKSQYVLGIDPALPISGGTYVYLTPRTAHFSTNHLVLTSPNGTNFKIKVDDNGILYTEAE